MSKGVATDVGACFTHIEKWRIRGEAWIKFYDDSEIRFIFDIKLTGDLTDTLFKIQQVEGEYQFSFYYCENLNCPQSTLSDEERTLGMLLRRTIGEALEVQKRLPQGATCKQTCEFNVRQQALADLTSVFNPGLIAA